MSEWERGYAAGWRAHAESTADEIVSDRMRVRILDSPAPPKRRAKKRKLSDWNKYVKANSKKPRFIYKSGPRKGRINLKKIGSSLPQDSSRTKEEEAVTGMKQVTGIFGAVLSAVFVAISYSYIVHELKYTWHDPAVTQGQMPGGPGYSLPTTGRRY